jgi:MFS family permease
MRGKQRSRHATARCRVCLEATVITAGSLADRFGRRLLGIGLGIFTATSLLCAASSSIAPGRRGAARRRRSRDDLRITARPRRTPPTARRACFPTVAAAAPCTVRMRG